jgi:hypothetical protein
MQKWVPQRVQLRYFSHTIKRALDADEEATEARYQQQRRRTRAEARRVAADRTGMMPIMQMLVDERTIAIVDMDYQRVTLLRCPGPPGAAPR